MDAHKSDHKETIENSRNLLDLLIMILKRYSGKDNQFLPEIQFLKDFSLTEIAPLTSCQPRTIIERMMKIHAEYTSVILKNPNYLNMFIYKYNFGEKEEEYIFSNNMPFYIDVITICFLQIMGMTKVDHVHPAIKDLIAIMREKYCVSYAKNFESIIMTESEIAISYPSISIPLYYYNNIFNPSLLLLLHISNLHFYLPWCSWLALIIPVIESEFKTPLALLLAMATVFDNDKPSYVLYQRILAFYTSEVFPRHFKLEICTCLGIVYKEEDKYRFASYFTKHREEAIKLISANINDTSIEYTLSQI